MLKVLAINGSPRKGKGNTAMVLAPFIQGITEAGAEVDLIYANELNVKYCSCGIMHCWYKSPGKCCFEDDMQLLYPKLKEADILIIATPVYIPLPGAIQIIINRLCPLVEPHLEFRQDRTRARFRRDVNIRKIILVSSGGWWEKENMYTVVRIIKELADNASVEFGGAILRPHAFVMKQRGQLTEDGEEIIEELRTIGNELIMHGAMNPGSIEKIGRPLISEEELRLWYNKTVEEPNS